MAGFDIIARLKLAGESFSSEFKSRMDGVEREARTASSKVGAAFAGVRGVATSLVSGLAAAASFSELLQIADQAKTLEAQLRLATREYGSFGRAQEDVARIADVTRNGLAETTSLYGNFVRASQSLGKGQGDAARATETFSKALKLGGADAAATASATLQFGQALASGALRGDEFNSIAEASPRILKLLADSMGLPQGQLRKLAEEGKLTADVLYAALTDRKFTDGIDIEFRQLPITFDEAMVRVNNAAVTTFGAFDRGGGFSTALANFVSQGADGFVDLEKRASDFGIMVAGTLAGLYSAFDPFKAGGSDAIDFLRGKFGGLRAEIAELLGAIDTIRNLGRGQGLISSETFNNTRLGGKRIGDTVFRLPGEGPRSDSRGDFVRSYDRTVAARQGEMRDQAIQDRFGYRLGTMTPEKRNGVTRPVLPLPSASGGGGGRSSGKSDAQRAAEQAEKDAARQAKADADARTRRDERFAADVRQSEANLRFLDMRRAGLEDQADLEERIFRINVQYGDETADQLATRRALATIEFNSEKSLERQKQAVADRADAERQAAAELERLREEDERRQQGRIDTLSGYFAAAMSGGVDGIWDAFEQQGERAISNLAAQWVLSKIGDPNAAGGGNPLSALMGLFKKKSGGGGDVDADAFLSGTLGKGDNRAGMAAAATVGIRFASDALGLKQSKLGGQVGSVAGNFIPGLPPGVGSALGEAVGSVVGGLFKATKAGFASFGMVNGSLGVASVGGNSSKYSAAASDAAGTVTQTLQKIAETLGGTLSGTATGSLGVRHGDYRYDPTGRGVTKKSKGAIDFDDDAEAAIAYAVSDLLKDGVLQGVSDAQKRLLQSGGDIEDAIAKATMLGEIPRLLKARLDPVGSAIDTVSKRFDALRKVMDEAGSSAAERAEAEQLYQLELDEAKRSAGGAADSLRDFLKSFQVGSASPLSLRDQEAAAQSALQPYLDKIAAGGSVDNDKYLAAAQDYLEVERQLNGSTPAYFEALAKVQAATNGAIANIDRVSAITPAGDPLAARTADATSATATSAQATAEILAQHTGILQEIAERIGLTGGDASSFIGGGRSFVQAA